MASGPDEGSVAKRRTSVSVDGFFERAEREERHAGDTISPTLLTEELSKFVPELLLRDLGVCDRAHRSAGAGGGGGEAPFAVPLRCRGAGERWSGQEERCCEAAGSDDGSHFCRESPRRRATSA